MPGAFIESHGRLIAALLRGSWRRTLTELEFSSAHLEEIVPLLLKRGAGALAWRRLLHSNLKTYAVLEDLHQAYRLYTLQAPIHERTIEQAFAQLRSAHIEPVLVKGWCAARLYVEQGLRPYGDIDLCVRRDQFRSAKEALMQMPEGRYEIDLHSGFTRLGGGKIDEIYRRSRLARLGEASVRMPGREDHLRILCMHFMREGGWRPLWLCDIAAAVEALPEEFDWSYCLGNSRSRSDAVICSIAAAHQLLGADIDRTPAARKTRELPRWLVPAILKEWGSLQPSMSRRHRAPIASYIRYPSRILQGLRDRWPNPIEATVGMRGPFNDFPRFPFQVGSCLARAAAFATRLKETRHDH